MLTALLLGNFKMFCKVESLRYLKYWKDFRLIAWHSFDRLERASISASFLDVFLSGWMGNIGKSSPAPNILSFNINVNVRERWGRTDLQTDYYWLIN